MTISVLVFQFESLQASSVLFCFIDIDWGEKEKTEKWINEKKEKEMEREIGIKQQQQQR